jgi:hypothetical protein
MSILNTYWRTQVIWTKTCLLCGNNAQARPWDDLNVMHAYNKCMHGIKCMWREVLVSRSRNGKHLWCVLIPQRKITTIYSKFVAIMNNVLHRCCFDFTYEIISDQIQNLWRGWEFLVGCSHNPLSQKGCWTTNISNQNWIHIYVLPFKAMAIMASYCFSFIWMLKNSNQKSIWWKFKFKFWFKTFKSD